MNTDTNLRTYQQTSLYREFIAETLKHSSNCVRDAQAAMNEAESRRRVDAAVAIRAGYSKVATANALGVSRPTLDQWLSIVENDPAEMGSVLQHEQFVTRQMVKD
jgi:hypothetical protein